MPRPARLQNKLYTVEVDGEFGRLRRVTDRAGGYELIGEPRLAESFRLLLPLPDMQANYILGGEQRVSAIEKDGPRLVLRWDGPLRNERGEYDLAVRLTIELVEERIELGCRVENRTGHDLAEVWYGILGGMTGLGAGDDAADAVAMAPNGMSHWSQPIFRDFGNTRGQTLGVLAPEHSFFYPGLLSMPWVCLYHPRLGRALYMAALEETPRVKAVRFAMSPGAAEGRPGGNWPRPDEVDGLPRGVSLNWVHFPYTRPGETFTGATVTLQAHAGDWRESAALYRRWLREMVPIEASEAHWMRRRTVALHTMFMLPEDNINLRFAQMGEWGRAAAERGVRHVMVAGWNIGGHDRGYPQYEPDPRLGTWDELRDGIRACHDLGLRVSFFVNCQPADLTTDWYKRELHRYRLMDRHGENFWLVNYWGMGTLGARNRFTATPFYEINPYHPEVRELLIRQFRKLVEIGADGLHIDKFFQTPFDFNPRLRDTSPDRAHQEGCLLFARDLVEMGRAINPDFCFTFEGNWDRLVCQTQTLWWGPVETPLKAVFPRMAFTAGVEQPYDYNKVNLAVWAGDNLLLGPANYNRGVDYPPMQELMRYIGEVTRIREGLFDLLCAGEWFDASQGLYRRREPALRVSGPFAKAEHARWSVFTQAEGPRRAAVLANLGPSPLRARVSFADGGRRLRVHRPFAQPRDARTTVGIEVPGERVAFVVEGEEI